MSSVKTNENIHKKEDGSYYMPTTTPPLPSRLGKAISLPQPLPPTPDFEAKIRGVNSVSDEKLHGLEITCPGGRRGHPIPSLCTGLT